MEIRKIKRNLKRKYGRQTAKLGPLWAQDPSLAMEQMQTIEDEREAEQQNLNTNNNKGKLQYEQQLKVATLNMHSLRDSGKREELEIWAEKENVDLILLQETWINQCAVERRSKYTIFFSSDDKNDTNKTEAGVAIMISNKHLNKIIDIDPVSDRLMAIIIRGTVTYTIINHYMHPSKDPEKNDKQYEELTRMSRKYKSGGPVLIGGDFNADIQSTDASGNSKVVGGQVLLICISCSFLLTLRTVYRFSLDL
jgi:endonuclease/exonuclease/phosphatase (EEP) superfamily protein YafD